MENLEQDDSEEDVNDIKNKIKIKTKPVVSQDKDNVLDIKQNIPTGLKKVINKE